MDEEMQELREMVQRLKADNKRLLQERQSLNPVPGSSPHLPLPTMVVLTLHNHSVLSNFHSRKQQEGETLHDTPETCIYSGWSPWSACSSATCEKGHRMRQRMLKAQLDLSVPCPHTQDFQPCMGPGCSIEDSLPCMLLPWSDWSDCSVTCGRGLQTRQRMLKSDPAGCSEELEQMEKCMLPECPADCMVSEWSEWSECNKSCGKGHTIRTRMVKLEPQFGGRACPETIQRKKCKIRKCRTKEGSRGAVGGAVGGQRRRRGKQGRDSVAEEQPGCRMQPWTAWTDCTKPCSGGIQERFIVAKERDKGAMAVGCKDRKEVRACKVYPC